MTFETVTNTDTHYYLIAYDKNGQERQDDPDTPTGRLSQRVREILERESISDVFLMSHGWKGDIPAAKEQYNAWIGSMLQCPRDLTAIRQQRPGFRPLLIGLHWPSLPWGEERLSSSAMSFGTEGNPMEAWVKDAVDQLVDTETARAAMLTIFTAAQDTMVPTTLPPEVVQAYQQLYREMELNAAGPGAAPGADTDAFDPERIYQQALDETTVSFGNTSLRGSILSVLQQLSFWQMKARARSFGEIGAATLLRDLQKLTGNRDVRFHLMGHSFGCIVISATIAGASGNAPLVKPVDSAFLVQGALSLWSYCIDIPVAKGQAGYFNAILRDHKVAGPLVTTQSEHDTAVGHYYPLGAGVKRQIDFAPGELPIYGGVGTFGLRGPGVNSEDRPMLPVDGNYRFEKGKVYNLESSQYICNGEPPSGAHSDIAKPEVAHAFWSAITA